MAIGDAAAAAGMVIVDGATTDANTIDTEINRSRDYIASFYGKAKAYTDAELNKIPAVSPNPLPNTIAQRDAGGHLNAATPTVDSHLTTKGYVDQTAGNINPVANTLARRDAAGHVTGATPTSNTHLATKQYVDAHLLVELQDLMARVETLSTLADALTARVEALEHPAGS